MEAKEADEEVRTHPVCRSDSDNFEFENKIILSICVFFSVEKKSVGNMMLLFSNDTTLSILHQINTIKHLGMMACTSKPISHQIKTNLVLWMNAGKLLCGSAHWPEMPVKSPPGSTKPSFDDPRYITMTRVCPWISEPRKIELGLLHSIRVFGGTYTFKSIDVSSHICRLTIAMKGDGMMRGGPTTHMMVRTDAYGTTNRFNAITRTNRTWQPRQASQEEQQLLEDLVRAEWRPTALYETDIRDVRIVHDGLFCVVACCPTASPTSNAVLYFVSTRTRSVLHTHRFYMRQQWQMGNVYFRPGEVWIYEDYLNVPTLTYFGPNYQRELNSYQEHHRRDAFWAMARGEADKAIQLLQIHFEDTQIYRLQENERFLVEAAIASENPKALNTLMTQFPNFAQHRFMYRVLDMGNVEMAAIFLQYGADPAAEESDAVRRIIESKKGSINLLDMIIAKGAVLNRCCMLYHVQPWTPVNMVAERLLPLEGSIVCDHEDNPLFVEWLLRGGSYAHHIRAVAERNPTFVNEMNSTGWTPLMLAAGTLDLTNVECLLELKADVNVYDDAHHSALDWCAAAGANIPPEWYSEAYYDQEAPACYEYGEQERSINRDLIHDMLAAEVERSTATNY